jgi:hypothetical protein
MVEDDPFDKTVTRYVAVGDSVKDVVGSGSVRSREHVWEHPAFSDLT